MNNRNNTIDYKKEFMKKFNALCLDNHKSHLQVWEDFIKVIAISLSNSVEIERDIFIKREKEYYDIIGKYKTSTAFAELMEIVVMALDNNRKQDYLGEIFMSLDGKNKSLGQHFTPYPLAELMAKLSYNEDVERDRRILITDYSCGSGVLLISQANLLLEKKINYQKSALFIAQDIDETAALMCYIQLYLLGCPCIVAVGDQLKDYIECDEYGNIKKNENLSYWFSFVYRINKFQLIKSQIMRETILDEDIFPHNAA